MLEVTGTIRPSDKKQVLDRMDLEQERGITIKLTPVRMTRKNYEFNLIDTPGHADFQYEVSRSLAAVEWVILLVDASQGIQAQTLSTLYMAIDQNLEIIPVLNKIDLPAANPTKVAKEIENLIGIDTSDIIAVSAKTWQNVELVLDAVIQKIQNPQTFKTNNLTKFRQKNTLPNKQQPHTEANFSRALIFDSVYDPYKWVLSYIKVVDGIFKAGEEIKLIHSNSTIKPTEVGYFAPDYHQDKNLSQWQIGYIVTGEKSVRDAKIGDTLLWGNISQIPNSDTKNYTIPGFKTVTPFVYAWVYPIDTSDYDKLKESLEKLTINDSAIEYQLEDSQALWFGFRCWFLGMLHMDIIRERISREYNIETIFTTPTVIYLVKSKTPSVWPIKTGRNIKDIQDSNIWHFIPEDDHKLRLLTKSGTDMIEQWQIDTILEPIAEVEVVGPQEFSGNIMWLCQEHRWKLLHMEYIDDIRTIRKYEIPLWELIVDFYDKLKSCTKGYATMNYEFKTYQPGDLVKLDIYINNEVVEALSRIVHKDKSQYQWKELVSKLKNLIPRHMFSIPLQAWIWGKMIARENISAMKKNVIAKCYGWDVSRKKKLLKKQKEWKKKMKAIWNVNLPSDIFIKMSTRG